MRSRNLEVRGAETESPGKHREVTGVGRSGKDLEVTSEALIFLLYNMEKAVVGFQAEQ